MCFFFVFWFERERESVCVCEREGGESRAEREGGSGSGDLSPTASWHSWWLTNIHTHLLVRVKQTTMQLTLLIN